MVIFFFSFLIRREYSERGRRKKCGYLHLELNRQAPVDWTGGICDSCCNGRIQTPLFHCIVNITGCGMLRYRSISSHPFNRGD